MGDRPDSPLDGPGDLPPEGTRVEPALSEDELSLAARASLARWQPPLAPADFATRVLAAADRRHGSEEGDRALRPRRLRWWLSGCAVGVAVVGAVAMGIGQRRAPAPPRAVASDVQFAPLRPISVRESLDLGGRGVAVAEAGAALSWRRAGTSTTIEQTAGEVFYRVEPGGRFMVTTAAGEIHVTGTCFRVEVIAMNPIKLGLLSASVGAAIATAAVVTVYEGKVVVASSAGRTEVRAGERAALTSGQAPQRVASIPPAPAPLVEVSELPPAPADATRDELLVRDRALREQVASLSRQVHDLQSTSAGPGAGDQNPDGTDWFEPGHDQLLAFAKECRVNLDYPPESEPMRLDDKIAAKLELGSAEVETANQAFAAQHADWARRVRALYLEATGDAQGAESLSVHAMGQELQDKAAPDEPTALRAHLAQERAGLRAAPADLSKTSAYERYFRALAGLGDETERALAAKLGGEKARALRAVRGGWPLHMGLSGCADASP